MKAEPSIQIRSARLILVGGLPGSGKSKFMERLAGEGWAVFDDFQKRAINNDASFRMSQHLPKLFDALRQDCRCVVADVRLVTHGYRTEALRTLQHEFFSLQPEFQIFERDDEQCTENIKNSPDPRDAPARLRILAEFGPQHSMPPEAVKLLVWRPDS